jgi:hypothetical protein
MTHHHTHLNPSTHQQKYVSHLSQHSTTHRLTKETLTGRELPIKERIISRATKAATMDCLPGNTRAVEAQKRWSWLALLLFDEERRKKVAREFFPMSYGARDGRRVMRRYWGPWRVSGA